MNTHYHYNDQAFEKAFEDRSFEPSLFSHEAHLRLAWIHIHKYGPNQACENVCRQIRAFDQTHGDGSKFHKTMTVAAVKAVYHFILKAKAKDFQIFIQTFPRLKTNFKALLDQHYGFDLLESKKARVEFVAPDLLAFD